jgi:hypothetical protein
VIGKFMRILRAIVFSSILVGSNCPVLADDNSTVSLAEPVDDIASAKELNRKGLVLLDAGDYASALPFFESSRALVRSYANTRNVALCLDALGRKKEALAMFEALLSDYADKLDADERSVAEKRVAELRQELAPPPLPPPVPAPAAVSVVPQPDKPRAPGRWSVGGFLGYAGGSSLGSDAEAYVATNCTTNCPATNGVMTGARFEFRVARLVTLEVSGGYLRVGSAYVQSWNNAGFTYTLDVDRTLSGGFIDFGTSMRWPFGDRIGLVGRFAMGGLFADVTNTNTGLAKGKTGQQGNLLVQGGRSSVDARSLYIRPELGLEVNALPFVLGVSVGAIVSTNSGPSFGELRLRTLAKACTSGELGACAPDLNVSTGNRGYGVFVAFVPQIGVRFRFD